MTREQALEVALRNMKILFDGMGGENRDMSSTVEFKCAELSPIYQQARAALALPPSKPETVNADMLAALQAIESWTAAAIHTKVGDSDHFGGEARKVNSIARAAIAKATS